MTPDYEGVYGAADNSDITRLIEKTVLLLDEVRGDRRAAVQELMTHLQWHLDHDYGQNE